MRALRVRYMGGLYEIAIVVKEMKYTVITEFVPLLIKHEVTLKAFIKFTQQKSNTC